VNNIRLAKPYISEDVYEKVKEVLDSGYLTEGPITHEFEEKVKNYVESKYAYAVPNCSLALEAACRAVGLGSGDELIAPDFTYPITAGIANLLGAESVLVDVNLDTYQMSMENIEAAINEKTKVVSPVSWGGMAIDIKPLRELQEKYNFVIIEDAAPSLGAEINGKKVGNISDISCFSFHPRKVITTGEGGMITTNNDEYASFVSDFKHFGIKSGVTPLSFVSIGNNYKLSNVLGAIGSVQMNHIDEIIKTRQEKAKIYNDLFEGVENIITPKTREGCNHVYQTYMVLLKKEGIRDEIIKKGKQEGIEFQIGTYALHLEPAFANTKKVGNLENSTNLYKNGLALPLHYDLSDEDQQKVADFVKSNF